MNSGEEYPRISTMALIHSVRSIYGTDQYF